MLRLLAILCAAGLETWLARLRHGPVRPSWSFSFQWLICFLRRDFQLLAYWPYAELRDELDSRRYPTGQLARVECSDGKLGSVPAFTYRPNTASALGVVLYCHGGSYNSGSARTTHADLLARLACATQLEVVGIDYRLVPEFRYPAALEDALVAFDALVAAGRAASEIVLMGDSAGGNLALALQLALRDRGGPQAAAVALISPWLDLTASRPSCRELDGVDYGHTSFLLMHARDFAPNIAHDDPRVSPINAELTGLSPLFVQVGGAERLRDEGREFVERAERAGVVATLDIVPDMPHNPPVFAAYHPAAEQAIRTLANYVVGRLDDQGGPFAPS